MTSSSEHIRVREEPRITANDLARYMVATETGKIGIIRRAKESPTAPRIRYKDARKALRVAMCDPASERRILAAARTALEQRADDDSLSNFARDDAEKSIEALGAFAEMRNVLAGYDYVPAPKSQTALMLSGVSVSVHCDILIHRTNREQEQIGGALLRLTKPEEDETERAGGKRREMGLYTATLVHMHVAENLAGNRTPHHALCWSVDIQNKEVHAAPSSYASRAQNLENACRFIGAIWQRV